jgi:hypothetical protein
MLMRPHGFCAVHLQATFDIDAWCREQASVFAGCCLLQVQKRSGIVIQVIPETPEGDISIPHLQQLLEQQVRCSYLCLSRCGG